MAEVLGTIAAVVGIAEAGSELFVFLNKFTRAASCPEKLKQILHSIEPEVSMISSVSSQLAFTLRDDETVRLCKFSTLATTKGMATESLVLLTETQKILQDIFKNGTTIGFLDRLKMYSIEKKVDVMRANIDRLRSKLLMIMEVIRFARGVVTFASLAIYNFAPFDNELETNITLKIVALKKEVMEKTIKCQRLSNAISVDGKSIAEQFSKLDLFFSSKPSENEIRQYKVVDWNGNYIAEKPSSSLLSWKMQNISQLITELEETRRDIAQVAQLPEEAGIWEVFKQNGVPHYRHTAITIRTDGPKGDGTRSITADWYPAQENDYRFQIPRHEVQVTDIYIALMGAVGTGKSTFVNVCLGTYLAATSQAPGRCTQSIDEFHFMYTDEIKVHLIDTPGFDSHRSEREILTELLDWTKTSQGDGLEQKAKRFSGILYFHKITDAKPQLSTHRNIRMLEKLCVPTTPTTSTPSSPPSMSSTIDPSFDPTFDPTFYPPSTTSTISSTTSAYTATSYYSPSTTSSTFTPTSSSTSVTTHTISKASLHPIILVTTNWEYFLGDDDRALQHESDLRTHDEYWGAMIRRGSTVVRYASADRESAMGVLEMLKVLEKVRDTSGGTAPGIPGSGDGTRRSAAPGGTTSPGSTTVGVGLGSGETGDMRYFPGAARFGSDDFSFSQRGPVEEPGEYERGRALSLSDTPASGGPAAKSIDAQVGELLAEFTTVVMSGPMMPEQHRRWTIDQTH